MSNPRESEILRAVHTALGSRPDVRIWRVNVGVAFPISTMRGIIDAVLAGRYARAVELSRMARPVSYGLPGMADLLGIVAPSGRLLSVECKSASGRMSEEQAAWDAMVRRFGGISLAPVRSVEDAERMLPP